MPDLEDKGDIFSRKYLQRRECRSAKFALLERLVHTGVTLRNVKREEVKLMARFHECNGGTEKDPYAGVKAMCEIVRALDVLRDRRRILLGIPLPVSRGKLKGVQSQVPKDIEATLLPAVIPENGAINVSEADSVQPGGE